MSDVTRSFEERDPNSTDASQDTEGAFKERRQKPDRRGTGRQGKYDRRRNRCGSCRFFEDKQQLCQFHNKPISADDFACPAFQTP